MNVAWASFAKRALEQCEPPASDRKRARICGDGATAATAVDVVEKAGAGGFVRRQLALLERGHAIVDGIRETLRVIDARNDFARFSLQVEVCEMFTSSMARIFYGEAYSENEYTIMQRNKWKAKDMNGFCLVQAQRQIGKSTVCGMQAAAVLCNTPNVYGFVIATQFDQACIILDYARTLIKKCFPEIRFKFDNKHMFVLDFGNGDERKFEALPDVERVRFASLSSPPLQRVLMGQLRLSHAHLLPHARLRHVQKLGCVDRAHARFVHLPQELSRLFHRGEMFRRDGRRPENVRKRLELQVRRVGVVSDCGAERLHHRTRLEFERRALLKVAQFVVQLTTCSLVRVVLE